jgi:uncharacterized protein with PIN domain
MRWLCDEMLGHLARVLRAAGEDVALSEPGASDATLLQTARRDRRILLTRDRRLAGLAEPDSILLRADRPWDQAEELAERTRIDWRGGRFTRCLMDNAVLRPATPGEIAGMPETAKAGAGPFRTCPACGRAYWPGSHVRRLAERLDRLAATAAGRHG